MSRFDDELTRTADNAWQMRGLPEPIDAPGYDPFTNMYLDGPLGLSSQPQVAPSTDAAKMMANQPVRRMINVTDLDTQDVMSQPGSSAVYASVDNLDDSLYQVYKASRNIRDAIADGSDFDFDALRTASIYCMDFTRRASKDKDINEVIGTIASIIDEIENNLVLTSDYKVAHRDLQEFETLLEDVNGFASRQASNVISDVASDLEDRIAQRENRLATNGNQETLQMDDVRNLDNVGLYEKSVSPDMTVDVTAPEEVNGQDAGYVPYYNDGAETGKVPQQGDDRNPFPYDQTNPALVPYAGTVASVQASREKIFEALQVVERLEKLGMVQSDDRAKHIAKFEQMSDAKLAGFKASLDMLEESGARQPRSQKVASGNNRMPEMGRLTTASTTTRESILADDWLMTL